MIRFATIGTNQIVDKLLAAAAHCPALVHSAVYSRREDTGAAFALKHGCSRVFTSLEALASDPDIDAVYIASPNLCHKEQALLMLQADKHVLCEKPIALTAADFEEMLSAAREHHVVLMEAMRPLHAPGLQTVQELLPRLGKIRRATLQFCQYSSRYDKFRAGIVENAFDPSLGNGALMDIGIYPLQVMEALFGLPRQMTGASVFLPTGVDGEGTLLAAYDEMLCEVVYSKITQGQTPSQIQGEDGVLLISGVNCITEVTHLPRRGEKTVYQVDLPNGGDMVCELESFVRQIENGGMEEEWIAHSRNVMALLDDARKMMGIDFVRK
ncbi:MAG: Gfo/Idh/MocA family oxidoreductase [Clostridiales bacterium]|nr:Gfo/Idh/MocA family oxidoreductase [Clostridiales bacterium]